MKYLVILLVFLAFFIRGFTQLDPDFGWHLRMGQIILSSGTPKTDPFSYSMSSYPFVDLSWLSGVILAWLYPKIGMIGLSLLAALITVSSLIVTLSIKLKNPSTTLRINQNNFYVWAGLLILSAAAIFPLEAVRIQVVSWLFLAIVLKIFLEQDRWERRRFLLPGLFLLWANLHGSFFVGLVVLWVGIIVRSWRMKSLKIVDVIILISSTILTLINPYGFSLYGEVTRTLWGSNLSGKIMEWMPAFFNFNLPFVALIPVSVLSVWHYRNKYQLEELVLFCGFLAAAIFGQRHIPLWIIACLPLLINSFHYFALEIKRIKFGQERMEKMVIFCFVGCLILFLTTLLLNLSFGLTENNFYPAGAVKYLKKNPPAGGQIFSEYGWGGYLIWKLPEKKVFIDGRMCTWPGIMKKNEAILTGKINYRTVFQQESIKVVLWPKARKSFLDQFIGKILQPLKKEDSFNLIKQIEKDGWQKVYEDKVVVIYSTI